ncbi:conserved protein of unknown function [Candidatus Hydrogenisulfobacillus filiaventi]|uniref:DUF1269 domain-containing protein n=1 Tax=Candidatus Hydrogenisulfobacillus filiaventi TaxID=2707344 RepID=A0A6F8ZHF0_9FIRM|nr:hypothetical protein [Bacillota bacterium]CAB1129028.1 conserved protein of unknown function [Candidatus Hydrogenisulfobacillus filiaventi]
MQQGQHTVAGVFGRRDDAEHTVADLRQQGIGDQQISLVAREDHGHGKTVAENGAGHNLTSGIGWGSAIGGVTGLLAGLGALAIPGVGPIVAAGPLAATLSGAAAGGLAGGLLDYGIPAAQTRQYEEDVKRGDTLLLVHGDEATVSKAKGVFERHHAHDIHLD